MADGYEAAAFDCLTVIRFRDEEMGKVLVVERELGGKRVRVRELESTVGLERELGLELTVL